MTPCLRKKHTSPVSNSKEIQSVSNALDSKTISRTKHIIGKTSKLNDNAKVICTRSMTMANQKRKGNLGTTNLQIKDNTLNEKPKSTRASKSSKHNVTNKTKLAKNIVHNVFNKSEQKAAGKTPKLNKIQRKDISNSKQMSLKESFLNASKIKTACSHKNSSEVKKKPMLKESLSKTVATNKKKIPVYEPLSPKNTTEAPSEVYEFKFDVNDSKERLPIKRKKRAKNTLQNKKKKNISTKHNVQGTKIQKQKQSINEVSETKDIDPVEENENSMKLQMLNEKDEIVRRMLRDGSKFDLTNTKFKESENIGKLENANNTTKPHIVSVECIGNKENGIKSTSKRSNSDDFKPFRPTNIFNNKFILQPKNALNSSLFEKSLSPIMKTSEKLDITSPWRVSQLCTFSQMRNVFQSTPQNTKFDISTQKFMQTLNDESIQINQMKVRNNLQKNDKNMSAEDRVINNTPKLQTLTSRKFGTEITNLDHSLQCSTVNQISERMATEVGRIYPNVQSVSLDTFKTTNVSQLENKRYSKYSNALRLQNSLLKEVKDNNLQNSQENIINTSVDEQKENSDPQPGPSGLQTRTHFNEQRILRQSNLNNFLNIMDMPQSTAVRTPHGIFADPESTTINSRSVKTINDSRMVLENAFGFNDDVSNQDIPSIEPKSMLIGVPNTRQITRLTIGEIKNLLVHNSNHEHDKENMKTKKEEEKKMHIKRRNKSHIDVANFSDTFDILSETGNTSVTSLSDIPLFADNEPTHFTQPPRHFYKRKRVVRFSFSEGESENEEDKLINHEVKRKKIDKFKKEQEARLREWVQNINRTFSEINEHELVIE